MEQNQKTYYIWNILFVIGLLLGTFLTNIFFKNQAEISNLWSLDQYSVIATGDLPQKQYFVFLLLRRGKQLLAILCLLFLTNRMVGIGVPLFLFAFSTSSLFALETMRMGIAGVFLGILYLIPHYFFYGMGVYGLAILGKAQSKTYKKLIGLASIIGIWLIGCYIEAFWNPELVKMFTVLLTKSS